MRYTAWTPHQPKTQSGSKPQQSAQLRAVKVRPDELASVTIEPIKVGNEHASSPAAKAAEMPVVKVHVLSTTAKQSEATAVATTHHPVHRGVTTPTITLPTAEKLLDLPPVPTVAITRKKSVSTSGGVFKWPKAPSFTITTTNKKKEQLATEESDTVVTEPTTATAAAIGGVSFLV